MNLTQRCCLFCPTSVVQSLAFVSHYPQGQADLVFSNSQAPGLRCLLEKVPDLPYLSVGRGRGGGRGGEVRTPWAHSNQTSGPLGGDRPAVRHLSNKWMTPTTFSEQLWKLPRESLYSTGIRGKSQTPGRAEGTDSPVTVKPGNGPHSQHGILSVRGMAGGRGVERMNLPNRNNVSLTAQGVKGHPLNTRTPGVSELRSQ